MPDIPYSKRQIVAGTRRSPLARWQTEHVCARLRAEGFHIEVLDVTTTGDKILDVPLAKIGDKGLFTKELDIALLEGSIDFAVHSLKDVPTRLPEGLILAAVLKRHEPWDAFVAGPGFDGSLADLPEGARVATSSLRRGAQLLAWRPDLQIVSVRGNVQTRLRHLEEHRWEGMVLAEAGLRRLGLESRIRARIPTDIMLPAVGQGAVAVVASNRDPDWVSVLREVLDDAPTRQATSAERAFLRRLEGGCQIPVGAFARMAPRNGQLALEGCVLSLDGRTVFREVIEGPADKPAALGEVLAEHLLSLGAREILQDIRAITPLPGSVSPPRRKPSVAFFRRARPNDSYEAIFTQAGWDVFSVPLLEYEFLNREQLHEALGRPEAFGALALTSPRALDAVESDPELLAMLESDWKGARTWIMGPETADRARALGLDVEGDGSGTGAKLALTIAQDPPSLPLLFLAGIPRREEFTEILIERGISFDEVVVYRADPTDAIAMPTKSPDWLAFFSPRGVRLAGERLDLDWDRFRIAAIGPTTAEALRSAGRSVHAEAAFPGPEALLAAMETFRREAG